MRQAEGKTWDQISSDPMGKKLIDNMKSIAKLLISHGANKNEQVMYKGKKMTFKEIAKKCNMSPNIVKLFE